MIKRLPIPYIWCILIGTGLGLVLGLKTYLPFMYWGETELWDWERMALPHFVNYTLWGFLVPLVYYFYQKYPVNKISETSIKVKAILASLAVATFHEVFSNIAWILPMHLLGIYPFKAERLQFIIGAFPSALISRLVEYWIIFSVFAAIDYIKKYSKQTLEVAQLENQLSQAKLKALKLQLHPHFLYNTLHTISSLMEVNVKKAQSIVSSLAKLLRSTLDKENRQFFTLEEELAFTKNYLDIESTRYSDRLTVRYSLDDTLMKARVPSFILQPLVENVVKHGMKDHSDPLILMIRTNRMEGDKMALVVEDNGSGSDIAAVSMNEGIGLKNLRNRLEIIYGDAAQMSIDTGEGKGFKVHIILPENPS